MIEEIEIVQDLLNEIKSLNGALDDLLNPIEDCVVEADPSVVGAAEELILRWKMYGVPKCSD